MDPNTLKFATHAEGVLDPQPRHVLFFLAGSGVTPGLAILSAFINKAIEQQEKKVSDAVGATDPATSDPAVTFTVWLSVRTCDDSYGT